MKKLLIVLIGIMLSLSTITVVQAKSYNLVGQFDSDGVFELFKENMDIVFADNSEYSVHNSNGDITKLFKEQTQNAYDQKNYNEIQEYFINNDLYILGKAKTEKEISSNLRSTVTVTYKRSEYYYRIITNGFARGEFGAYVWCNATIDDRTGRVVNSYAPYFGKYQVYPGSYIRVSVDGSSYVSGNTVYFNLKSFQVTSSDSSGFVVGVVQYNREICNIEDFFQPANLL